MDIGNIFRKHITNLFGKQSYKGISVVGFVVVGGFMWDTWHMGNFWGASDQQVGSALNMGSFHGVGVVDDVVAGVISVGHWFDVVTVMTVGPSVGNMALVGWRCGSVMAVGSRGLVHGRGDVSMVRRSSMMSRCGVVRRSSVTMFSRLVVRVLQWCWNRVLVGSMGWCGSRSWFGIMARGVVHWGWGSMMSRCWSRFHVTIAVAWGCMGMFCRFRCVRWFRSLVTVIWR